MACSVNSTHAFGLLYCDWEAQLHVFLFFRYVPPRPVPYSWKCRTIHRHPCLFSASPSSLRALHKLCDSREITILEGLTLLGGVAVLVLRARADDNGYLLSSAFCSVSKIAAATQHGWPPSAKQNPVSACKLSFHISLPDLACLILNIMYF